MAGNIADYVDRTVDVSLFQGVQEGKNNPLEMSLIGGQFAGTAIAGAAKLAQRFFLEFMTERGSIPSQPNRGSDFMFEARTGQLRTTAEAEQEFYLSVDQIRDALVAEEEEGIPDDEAFASATLETINLSADKLTIRAIVRSQAGTSRQVILPISTRVR